MKTFIHCCLQNVCRVIQTGHTPSTQHKQMCKTCVKQYCHSFEGVNTNETSKCVSLYSKYITSWTIMPLN